ncbi:hypothetical protein ABW19_dt0201439 [Dactylella cylindrospora]|nr:hypothetical protein ABW19_dt0201439 [Dactylella cylindrospora]
MHIHFIPLILRMPFNLHINSNNRGQPQSFMHQAPNIMYTTVSNAPRPCIYRHTFLVILFCFFIVIHASTSTSKLFLLSFISPANGYSTWRRSIKPLLLSQQVKKKKDLTKGINEIVD